MRASASRTTASAWRRTRWRRRSNCFRRRPVRRTASTGGLGLGLALVKSLVDRHDGTVSGHSAGKGCGSEFVVSLPLLAAARRDAAGGRAADAAPAAAGLRLLIVDDNRDAAEMLGM